jgi:hypothetical protein
MNGPINEVRVATIKADRSRAELLFVDRQHMFIPFPNGSGRFFNNFKSLFRAHFYIPAKLRKRGPIYAIMPVSLAYGHG